MTVSGVKPTKLATSRSFPLIFLRLKYPAVLVDVPVAVPAQMTFAPGRLAVSAPSPPAIITLPSIFPWPRREAGMIIIIMKINCCIGKNF